MFSMIFLDNILQYVQFLFDSTRMEKAFLSPFSKQLPWLLLSKHLRTKPKKKFIQKIQVLVIVIFLPLVI